MTRIGIFNNMINSQPLNARISFVINNNIVYPNHVRYNQTSNNLIISTISDYSGVPYYLHMIVEIIRINNIGNDVPIHILNYGIRYQIDSIDTSSLEIDGILRFHLIRDY